MEVLFSLLCNIRAVVAALFILVAIILIAFLIYCLVKKKNKKIIVLLSFAILVSVYLPLRMFIIKQEFVPRYSVENLSVTFEQFYKAYTYGQEQRLIDKTLLNTRAGLSDYDNNPDDKGMYMGYCVKINPGTEETDYEKSHSVKSGESDGIQYWLSGMSCESWDDYGPLVGIYGIVLLQNDKGETIKLAFKINNYQWGSSLFPIYPKEFKSLSLLIEECKTLK